MNRLPTVLFRIVRQRKGCRRSFRLFRREAFILRYSVILHCNLSLSILIYKEVPGSLKEPINVRCYIHIVGIEGKPTVSVTLVMAKPNHYIAF